MRLPRFVAEMDAPAHRGQLRTSVQTGYLTTVAFAGLVALAHVTRVVPFHAVFLVPIVAKLASSTCAAIALRLDRAALFWAGVNVLMDLFALTCAVYFSGGELSPLFPIYLIEVTVVALLGNPGLTVLCAVMNVAFYAAMALLVRSGVLQQWPPPVALTGGLTGSYIAVDLVYAAFVVGLPTYYTARILQNLRDRKEALEERTRALVEAGRQRSQFMANVTHELRTPIHGICGLSDLIESGIYGPVSAKQRDAQQAIKRSARSLLALIDDLLELSRADAGKLELRPERVELGELLPTVVAAARWMVGTKSLDVETLVPADLPNVETDPRGLNQVLLNLLSNAAKFTADGGRIVVRARREGDAVRIEVADTGIGIAADDRARIFDEFHQLDGTAERAYGGVGLGLAVVRRLTAAMGARVELESEPGKGSTFAVVVPVQWDGRPQPVS
jgi:signal transduction histidine kinase